MQIVKCKTCGMVLFQDIGTQIGKEVITYRLCGICGMTNDETKKIRNEALKQRRIDFKRIQEKIRNGTAENWEIILLKQEAKMFEEQI